MKKIYLLAFLILYTSMTLWANGVEIDGIYYLIDTENHTATVTYPNETTPVWNTAPSTYSGTINIPSSITHEGQTYTVNAIGEKAFLCTKLTSITLPNTIISIGNGAFYDHRGITTLELPNLQSIGNEAFRWCTSLKKVIIPECIQSLGISIFQRCIGITEIQLPQSLTSLPYAFLYACSSLKTVTLPPDITSIPNECFTSCASLQYISLPIGVKSIGYQAFKGDLSFKKFYIPKNVTSLGDEILEGYPQDPYTGGAVPQAPSSSNLKYVFIDNPTPPSCSGTNKAPFLRVDKSKVYLFVPEGSIDAYRAKSEYANYFKGIYAFGAGVSNIMDATDTSAIIMWFPVTGVKRYVVSVRANNQQYADFEVDSTGNVLNSVFHSPAVVKMPKDTTNSSTEYFVIALDDLESDVDYSYTINGTNAQNAPVYHEEGSFTIPAPEGFVQAITDDPHKQVRKIIRDGQLVILREEKEYTPQGQQVK